MKCKKCMTEMPDDGRFCPSCGEEVIGGESHGKKKNLWFSLCICAVTVAIVAGAAFYMKPSKEDADAVKENAFYIKDRDLYRIDLTGQELETEKLSELFEDDEYEGYYYQGLAYGFYGIEDPGFVSRDGKFLVYPEASDTYGSEFNLYGKFEGEDPVKLDRKVSGYKITNNNLVIYSKNGSGLYVSDGNVKKRLSSKADVYYTNDTGDLIVWAEPNKGDDYTWDLYYQRDLFSEEKTKFANSVEFIKSTDNFEKILIRKKNSLYLIENFGDPVKLVEDADEVRDINLENMTFYFAKQPQEKHMMIDYIEDDTTEQDAAVKESAAAEEDTALLGQDSLDEDYDYWPSYLEDRDNEYLKSTLERQEANLFKELYYYNNGEEILIDTAFRSFTSYDGEESEGVITYIREKDTSIKKIKMSDITYADYAIYDIQEANYVDEEEIFLKDGKTIGFGELSNYYMGQRSLSDDKSRLYFTCSEEEVGWQDETTYDLYYLSLAEEDFGKIIKVDEKVDLIECTDGSDVYYMKETKDYVGDLYVNGNLLLKDVNEFTAYQLPEKGGIVCISDIAEDGNYGTLNVIKEGIVRPIADQISYCDVISENCILLLRNYNEDKSRGDLEYYDGENIHPIDTDVFSIIPRGQGLEAYSWYW